MPKLIRLFIHSTLIGFGLAVIFVGLLVWQNVGNLAHLVTHTADGPLALALLVMFNGLVFSAAQIAVAVLLMTDKGTSSGPGGNTPVALRIPTDDSRH